MSHTYPYGKPFFSGSLEAAKLIDFDKLYSNIGYPEKLLQCKFINRGEQKGGEEDVKVIDMFYPRVDIASVGHSYQWVKCSIQKM